MHEEKESSCRVTWTTEQGKEKEPITRGEREAFKALKRSAKEALGLDVCAIQISYNGYLSCKLRRNGILGTCGVHRIIMMVFLGRELATEEHVHHLNQDKRDNRIENLEILPLEVHMEVHWAQKRHLTKDQVLEIRRLNKIGSPRGWKTAIAKKFKVDRACISFVVSGTTYKKPEYHIY